MALTEMSDVEPDIHKFNLSKNNQVTAACWIHHVFLKIIEDLNFSDDLHDLEKQTGLPAM